jgi:ubiquinone/menaquinone biosynthesis C-methylase UbiE
MIEEKTRGPVTIMRDAYAVYPSFAMLAGMQLDVFTPLRDGPMDAGCLAKSLMVQPAKLLPLLYALAAAGHLTVQDGQFSNTEESDRYLVRGRPEYMGGLSGFYNGLWQSALKTAESIRSGKPQAKLDWRSLPEDELIKYFKGQYPGSLRAGKQLSAHANFTKFKRLLDAGGGTGGLSIGICESCPDLEATVLDLPAVVSISQRFISEAGMSGRITAASGDLINGTLEGSYDVAVLRALVQVMPPEHARKALKNISRVIQPGGSLYIVGCVLDNTRLSPIASIAFSLVFLNVYDDGGAYTEKEHVDWLEEAGFADIAITHNALSDGLSIISAHKV